MHEKKIGWDAVFGVCEFRRMPLCVLVCVCADFCTVGGAAGCALVGVGMALAVSEPALARWFGGSLYPPL